MGAHDDEASGSRVRRTRQKRTVEEALLPEIHQSFLQWPNCEPNIRSIYNTNLGPILNKQVYSPCLVNWELLNTMGCAEEIAEMLVIEVKDYRDRVLFRSEAWRRVFDIRERIYPELCKEFYATLEFNEKVLDDDLWDAKILKFRLAGRQHSLTLMQFARRLGLYTHAETGYNEFRNYFLGGMRSAENFNASEYWLRISRENSLSLSRSHASSIRRPVLRVLHKMIVYGLCQRANGHDKIQKNNLWLLSMFESRHNNGYANIAWVIAKWMKKKGVGSTRDGLIFCGQFITRIAKAMNLLTDDTLSRVSAPIECRELDRVTFRELIGDDSRLIDTEEDDDEDEDDEERDDDEDEEMAGNEAAEEPEQHSMEDLYTRMRGLEIRQGAIEQMSYRQSYHWDRYHGLFDHMACMYIMQLDQYNPPPYAQPQYDQYYQQFQPPPQQQQPGDDQQ